MGSIQATVDVDNLLSKLTLEEKVSLLAAKDWWRTPTIKREGIFVPHIKVIQKKPQGQNCINVLTFSARQLTDQMALAVKVMLVESERRASLVLQA